VHDERTGRMAPHNVTRAALTQPISMHALISVRCGVSLVMHRLLISIVVNTVCNHSDEFRSEIISGSECALGLRVGSYLLDGSHKYVPAMPYQQDTAEACLRFADSDVYMPERALKLLLRALQTNSFAASLRARCRLIVRTECTLAATKLINIPPTSMTHTCN
jgi:hypothetical protein